MSRLGCSCGNIMSTVECPSPCLYHVYLQNEVEQALKDNPQRLFWDFHTNWDSINDEKFMFKSDEFFYWYCPKCGRFYQVELKHGGKWVRKYKKVEDFSCVDDSVKWSKIYVYSDIVVDKITEKDFSITLRDFIKHKSNPFNFYISEDLKTVIIRKRSNNELMKIYKLEEIKPSDATNI